MTDGPQHAPVPTSPRWVRVTVIDAAGKRAWSNPWFF
jgi:hypothetical protein